MSKTHIPAQKFNKFVEFNKRPKFNQSPDNPMESLVVEVEGGTTHDKKHKFVVSIYYRPKAKGKKWMFS